MRPYTFVLAAVLAAAGCTETSTPVEQSPPQIASVTVSPPSTTLKAGETVRLTAAVVDEEGRTVDGRSIEWFSYDASIATVSNDGVVTGVAAGAATVVAAVEGKRGSARITVTAVATGVVIAAVSPNPLVEGQPATIQGSNFGLVASNIRVTIDGVIASVAAATATSIQIMVPQTGCKPARAVDVQVRVLASSSNAYQANMRPAQYLSLPVGQLGLARDPNGFCVQFAPGAASESYLIGVQSVAENVTTLTPAMLAAISAGPAGAIAEPPAFAPRADAAVLPPHVQQPNADYFRAEAELQRHNRALFERLGAQAAPQYSASQAVPTIPSGARIGDVLGVRVPAWDNQCTQFAAVNAVVRHIGNRAIWLEDVANPAGGYSAADYQALATFFDNVAYNAATEYFGLPTDLDRNGRVAFVISKEVNRQGAAGDASFSLGGFVKTANYFATSTCPSSNEGEVIYLRAPDPTGRFGRPTGTPAEERLGMTRLLPHEFSHVIQFARQMPGSGYALQPSWLIEGQATLIEEVVGHRLSGRAAGRNYGADVVFDAQPVMGIDWYRGVSWAAYYYGWLSQTSRVPNAPEQCSWVGASYQGNNGPCTAPDNLMYGMSFMFLRWLADQYGPLAPGGERAVMEALVVNRAAGFAAVAAITGRPIDELLAQFAAALYVDDRVPAAAPGLRFTSWNLFDIEQRKHVNAQLTPRERGFTTFQDAISVRAGSTAYFRVSGAGRAATAIRVTTPAGGALPADMRLWIVRLQ